MSGIFSNNRTPTTSIASFAATRIDGQFVVASFVEKSRKKSYYICIIRQNAVPLHRKYLKDIHNKDYSVV